MKGVFFSMMNLIYYPPFDIFCIKLFNEYYLNAIYNFDNNTHI